MRDTIESVTAGLSALIALELIAMRSEYWTPQFAADQMDAELAFRKTRIQRLREIRAEFENIMHGMERGAV